MLIALMGPMHVGKSTLAQALVDNPPLEGVGQGQLRPLATPVKLLGTTLQEALDLPTDYIRPLLQALGHGTREVLGDDVWVDYWQNNLPEGYSRNDGPFVVVDDVRYANELDACIDGLVILLIVDREKQWDRYLTSAKFNPAIDKETWLGYHSHATELLWQEVLENGEADLALDTTDMTPAEVEAAVRGFIRAQI